MFWYSEDRGLFTSTSTCTWNRPVLLALVRVLHANSTSTVVSCSGVRARSCSMADVSKVIALVLVLHNGKKDTFGDFITISPEDPVYCK
jgi:phosphoglucomutase